MSDSGYQHLRARVLANSQTNASAYQTPAYIDISIIVFLCLVMIALMVVFNVYGKAWRQNELNRFKLLLSNKPSEDEKAFKAANGYCWDMVIVFRYTLPTGEGAGLARRKKSTMKSLTNAEKLALEINRHPMHLMVFKLQQAGLGVKLFYGLKDKYVYCKIRASKDRLLEEADRVRYKLRYKPELIKGVLDTGNQPKWQRVNTEGSLLSTIGFCEYIHGKFALNKDLYNTPTSPNKDSGEDVVADEEWKHRRDKAYPLNIDGRGKKVPGHGERPHYVPEGPVKLEDLFEQFEYPQDDHTAASPVKFFLRDVDRIQLIHSIITDAPLTVTAAVDGHRKGAKITIEKHMSHHGLIKDYFPLHDYKRLHDLALKWQRVVHWPKVKWASTTSTCSCVKTCYSGPDANCSSCFPCCTAAQCFPDWTYKNWFLVFLWPPLVDEVREYYGEEIALHCLWLNHMTNWLTFATFVGICAWIHIAYEGNDPNSLDIPFYSGFVGLWSTVMLEYFKRLQSYSAMRWGTTETEKVVTDIVRHDYDGDKATSPIDGTEITYASASDHVVRIFATALLFFGIIAVVVLCTIALFLAKASFRANSDLYLDGFEIGGIIIPILQTFLMIAFDVGFRPILLWMIQFENHRTDAEHESAIILKLVTFRFVNNFIALFYIAFVKPFFTEFDPCTADNCMKELQISLGTIFTTKLLCTFTFSVLMPILFLRRKESEKKVDEKDVQEDFLEENKAADYEAFLRVFRKPNYDSIEGTFEDYSNHVILFGFTTMFISAFPIGIALALCYNYLEMRLLGWKLSFVYRRTMPRRVSNIGVWYYIFEAMAAIAVVVNAALVAFTQSITASYTGYEKVWLFMSIITLILGIKYAVAVGIADVPSEVVIQREREEFINKKIVDDEPDEIHLKEDDPKFTVYLSNMKIDDKVDFYI